MNKKIKTTPRKQKYPFKTIGVGGEFKIKSAEYNSMMTSYRQHNKNHAPIVLESEDLSSGQILIRRVQ